MALTQPDNHLAEKRVSAGPTTTANTLGSITPLLITFNEEPNIGRVLEKLSWAQRIVVIDSGSTDGTLGILRANPSVDVHHRPFTTFAEQCNFGLQHVRSPWVLSLDADYVLSNELVQELRSLNLDPNAGGYSASFRYVVHGRPLRGSLYPPRTVLYQASRGRYRDEGHGHRVDVTGPVLALRSPILHDDRKPLSRWFGSQQRYAAREADHLLSADRTSLRLPDRLRLLAWPAPPIVFVYALVVKGCIWDGWRGWHYVFQRVLAECLLAIEIIDRRFDRTRRSRPRGGGS